MTVVLYCGAFRRISIVPKTVKRQPHSTIGMNDVHGSPVRSQQRAAEDRDDHGDGVADGEHAAGHAVYVAGRAQDRRQSEGDDEGHGCAEASGRSGHHDPDAVAQHDADECPAA